MKAFFSRTTSGHVLVFSAAPKGKDFETHESLRPPDPVSLDISAENPPGRCAQLTPVMDDVSGPRMLDPLIPDSKSSNMPQQKQLSQSALRPYTRPTSWPFGRSLVEKEAHQTGLRKGSDVNTQARRAHTSIATERPIDVWWKSAGGMECADISPTANRYNHPGVICHWSSASEPRVNDETLPPWIKRASSLVSSHFSDAQSTGNIDSPCGRYTSTMSLCSEYQPQAMISEGSSMSLMPDTESRLLMIPSSSRNPHKSAEMRKRPSCSSSSGTTPGQSFLMRQPATPKMSKQLKADIRRRHLQELTEKLLKLESVGSPPSDSEQSDGKKADLSSRSRTNSERALDRQFFEAMEVRQNLRPHDALDKELEAVLRERKSGNDSFSVLRRIALATFFLGATCVLMFYAFRGLRVWFDAPKSPVEAIRFNVDSVPAVALQNMSLLGTKFKFWDGHCEIKDLNLTADENSILFNNTKPHHAITAYEIHAGEVDLVVRTVDFCSAGKLTYQRSTNWEIALNGSLHTRRDWLEPGIEGVVHRLQPPWTWVLAVPMTWGSFSLAMFSCFLSLLGSKMFSIHSSLRYAFAMVSVLSMCHFTMLISLSMYTPAFITFTICILYAKCTWEMESPKPSKYLRVMGMNYFLFTFLVVIEHGWVLGSPDDLIRVPQLIFSIMVGLSAFIFFQTRMAYRRHRLARLHTKLEATGVSRVWKELMTDENKHAKEQTFAEFLSKTFPGLHDKPDVRHTFRPAERTEVDDREIGNKSLLRHYVDLCSVCTRENPACGVLPTESLDQLFQQAAVVQPFFMRRLRLWAAESKAWLPARTQECLHSEATTDSTDLENQSPDFILYTGKERDDEISWPTLKCFDSTIEKIVSRYDGDTSRCCDIVRGVLLFKDFEGISESLRIIATDPWISVSRVKSTFSTQESWNDFRFVRVNFCFASESAMDLGVEGFVCELIVTFKDLWVAKDERQYQALRKMWKGLGDQRCSLMFPFRTQRPNDYMRHAPDISPRGRLPVSEQAALVSQEGDVLEPEVASTCISRFRESSCTPAGQQDKEILEGVEEAVRSADMASVWLMATPVDAALAKPQYFVLIVMVVLAISAAMFLHCREWTSHRKAGTNFRFISYATRSTKAPRVHSFGLLSGGCNIEEDANATGFDINQTAYLSFRREGVDYDGWYFVTSGENPDHDPVIFSLEVEDPPGTWEMVGSSGSKEIAANTYHHELVEFSTPLERQRHVSFTVVMTQSYFGGVLAEYANFIVYGLVFIFRQVTKRQHKSQKYFTYGVVTYGTILIVSSVIGRQNRSGVWMPQVITGSLCCLVAVRLFSGRGFHNLPDYLILCFTTSAVLFFTWDLRFYAKHASMRMIPFLVYPCLALGVSVKVLQIYTWWRIQSLMQRDKAINVGIWDEIVKKEGEVDPLKHVSKLLQPYAMPTSAGVHQRGVNFFGSLETDGILNPYWWSDVSLELPAGDNSVGVLQTSLSMLLHQARSLQPDLFEKVQKLSLASNGLVLVEGDDGNKQYVAFSEVLEDPRLLETVKWPPLKKIDRIRQKLVRCYKSDVSKLCDLCRATIVHRSL